MKDLFDSAPPPAGTPAAPLAERRRPRNLEQIRGQDHLLSPGRPFRQLLTAGRCPSLVLWGPPGSGKTTLARLLAELVAATFVPLSAVTSGVKDLKEAFEAARIRRQHHGQTTLLFVDEIHRFNRAQQDALLPHVESGMITFVGATTENPSFEVNAALLSRCQVLTLKPLSTDDLLALLQAALSEDAALARAPNLTVATEALRQIAHLAAGDARMAMNILEATAETARQRMALAPEITRELVADVVQTKAFRYDASGEEHYNLISALHKSLRGSDPDAALYWLYRMIDSGEDCRFILRRLVRFASEDVGMADPYALTLATSAIAAFDYIGAPEGHLALAHLTVYLALAPKSNALYVAEATTRQALRDLGEPPVPLHLRNAPTPLMKAEGYGLDYRYPHDFPDGFIPDEHYFPEGTQPRALYQPKPIGKETSVMARLHQLWPGRHRAPPRK